MNIDLTNGGALTGTLLQETRTSEVATYVSNKQIEALPQGTRNFLAFADTVPGMQFITSGNGNESTLRSGAQGSSSVSAPHPVTEADLQSVLRDEWSRQLFWVRGTKT